VPLNRPRLPFEPPRLAHRCHARGCPTPVTRRLLMCAPHWARVPPELQAEVYRAVKLRGSTIDATWAPWWRAAHRAIAHVAATEGQDVAAYLTRELAFADRLERKDP